MLQKIVRVLGGDPQRREIEKLSVLVLEVNALEAQFEALSDDALLAKTAELRTRYQELVESGLKSSEALDDILPHAFAAVREASKRTIGLRHYDVQLIGGAVLHQGNISEMRTGEGKTLVATLALYLNTITGLSVHLVTVNDYLARRDARWMAPIFKALGLTVGVLQMAARTDNGKNAFIIDPERPSPHEDQHQLRMVPRKDAYSADITYGTNAEFGFDYLRDNLTMSLEERVQRGHYFAIVDEVDNILVDEARTPLIISGPAADDAEWYIRVSQVVRQLNPEDYEISERERTVSMTELGEAHVEELLDTPLKDPERPEDITPEQARLLGFLEQALRAHHLYKRNKDYLVQGGKVIIVDEFTGRLMPGRRWSEGLHQSIEAKEGVKVEPENVTYATITLQNYYRMYEKLAGMTGTASTEAEEFHKIYKLEVITIPTNLEYEASRQGSELITVNDKDEQGYKYLYYARREDPNRLPVFWKRKDFTDVVYRTEEAKLRAITQEILRYHVIGRPQLVGTTSVEHSERLSRRLQAEPIRRLAQVLTIRQAYLDREKKELLERPVPELQPLNTPLSDLDTGSLRPLARSLGVSLNPEDEENLGKLLGFLGLQAADKPRLLKAMQGGVSHQVLNARKHDEESQIIARAGAFGAVTIATNMAGRGVDIKLGGDLPEDVYNNTNRIISRLGLDPYNMTSDERRQALQKVPVEDYGIYEESVNGFLEYEENMERVRSLGGLHVIGSERHEARRIDNQLRGRAARQGDPGSSRFYLSLEDELMRLFGGPQVESLWKRVFFDDSLPLEMGLLGRLVEQSQERVEGYNFDVRKHLLEYDDVLNSQRKRIYEQRDRAFTKEDLSEDVLDMLRTELQQRIPEALKDEEGPWKLLAYLEEIQPAFSYGEHSFPSFPLTLLRDETAALLEQKGQTPANLVEVILETAGRCLEFEKEHILNNARSFLEKAGETLDHQLEERFEILDNFAEGLGEVEEGSEPLRPQDLLTQLSEAVRVPIKLNSDQLRRLPQHAQDVFDEISQQVGLYVKSINLGHLNNSLERRLEEPLGLRLPQLLDQDWPSISSQFLEAVQGILDRRIERLLGEQGQIAVDLNTAISRSDAGLYENKQIVQWLLVAATGSRTVFDPKTHRKGLRRVTRLNYIYLSAQTLRDTPSVNVTEMVLHHMEEGLEVLQAARGAMVWQRMMLNGGVLRQLDDTLLDQLSIQLGDVHLESLADQPLKSFSPEDRDSILGVFGRRLQNQAYRELFLRVISDQWVDYLTRVEALRVSVGLESYGQRDPLVQYKSQATDMFRSLLAEIRMGIIARLFTYQPRFNIGVVAGHDRSEENPGLAPELEPDLDPAAEVIPPMAQAPEPGIQGSSSQKKKRRRH